jgi:putative transposase
MWADEQGIDARFLIRDHDTRFTEAFDQLLARENGGPVFTHYGAPVANSFAGSWIGSIKRECLNHFFCFSLAMLDHIVQTYANHCNRFRPHPGLGNRPPGVLKGSRPRRSEIDPKSVQCQSSLGGLLTHYE